MVWVKKSSGKNPGYHPYTAEDMKRVSWCIDRRIKIAVIPSGTKWQIEISINKDIHLDSNIYEADVAYKKMYEYYKYYYDKHNKQ
jgi:hypothetical protein